MVNIVKMDIYRLFKSTSYKVMMLLVVIFNFIDAPVGWALIKLAKRMGTKDTGNWPSTVKLSSFVSEPLGWLTGIFILMSVVWFSYSDLGHGYIKNIAGQLPKKGQTVISKFIAVELHNLILMIIAVISNTLGYLPFSKIDLTTGLAGGIRSFLLKYLLLMAISAIVLFFSTGLKSKNAATVIAILMGSKLLQLSYILINMGLQKIPFSFMKDFDISKYMPDSLITSDSPPVVRSLIVSACFIVVLINLTISIFNKKDIT